MEKLLDMENIYLLVVEIIQVILKKKNTMVKENLPIKMEIYTKETI